MIRLQTEVNNLYSEQPFMLVMVTYTLWKLPTHIPFHVNFGECIRVGVREVLTLVVLYAGFYMLLNNDFYFSTHSTIKKTFEEFISSNLNKKVTADTLVRLTNSPS